MVVNKNKQRINERVIAKNKIFGFLISEVFNAGIVLLGAEIKSLRIGNVAIGDSYALLKKNELFLHNMSIANYQSNSQTFTPKEDSKRKRKLLLRKNELKKISKLTKEKRMIILPLKVFINERGWAKVEIAVSYKMKKHQLKTELKEKEIKRKIENKDFY